MTRDEFHKILLDNQGALRGYAFHLLGDGRLINDLVQEVNLRALEGKVNPNKNIRAWLYRIMYNVFVDQYNHKKKYPLVQAESMEAFVRGTSDRPDSIAISHDINDAIDDIGYSKEYLKMFMRGYKYKEIAEHYNVNVCTIGRYISDARQKLKSLINA